MTTPHELITILDRIIDGKKDKKDIALLRQWLENSNNQNLMQSAKYIVNIYDSQGLYIGDRITQAQWRGIAKLPKIKRCLKVEPSCFKGDNLPVERVSWHDAQEFCERLSRETGRKYRLPSEAEWEYACRAQTSTPFHFGKIITPNLANYFGHNKNIHTFYHQQTIEVGNFPANAFGLCDMHSCCDYSLHIEVAGPQGARERTYRFCLIMLVMQFVGATAYHEPIAICRDRKQFYIANACILWKYVKNCQKNQIYRHIDQNYC